MAYDDAPFKIAIIDSSGASSFVLPSSRPSPDFLRPPVKGSILRAGRDSVTDEIEFQFNPTSLTEQLSANWYYTESRGQVFPAASFNSMGAGKLNVQLMLYGRQRDRAYVSTQQQIAQLKSLIGPSSAFTASTPRFVSPGKTLFVWGSTVIPVRIDSLRNQQEMFDRQLRVFYAVIDLDMTVVSMGLTADAATLRRQRLAAGFSLPGFSHSAED